MADYTIVVLHGWEQGREFWNTFTNQFGADRAVAIDLPGFGAEPLVDPSWGIPEYAEWTMRKIEGMNKERVVLLGHSFGGRIAGLVASRNPSWLSGVILYEAPCLYRPKFRTRMTVKAAKLLKKLGVKRRYINEELRAADERGKGDIFRRAVAFDETESLRKISAPTLLIWGGNDTPEAPLRIAREMHALISGSELRIMEGVGHNAHLENPALFYGIVAKFIKRIGF